MVSCTYLYRDESGTLQQWIPMSCSADDWCRCGDVQFCGLESGVQNKCLATTTLADGCSRRSCHGWPYQMLCDVSGVIGSINICGLV